MTTLEKAAQAAYLEIQARTQWAPGSLVCHDAARYAVIAVLKTIREYDGYMQAAYWREMGDGASFSDGVRGYQAMIDAILAEGK